MPNYVALMIGTQDAFSALPAERQAELWAAYGDWMSELKEHDAFLGGASCSSRGWTISNSGQESVVAPQVANDPCVLGYFLISAPSEHDAIQLALRCPALGHGEVVQLRQIE